MRFASGPSEFNLLLPLGKPYLLLVSGLVETTRTTYALAVLRGLLV